MKLVACLLFWYFIGRKIKYETWGSLILGVISVFALASIL